MTSNIPLLTGPIDPSMETFNELIQDINESINANSGGTGTVTSVTAGTGLSGGTITATGTIAIANSSANTLSGYDNSGVFSDVTVGSNLTLSGGTLSASTGATTFAALTDVLVNGNNNMAAVNHTVTVGAPNTQNVGFGPHIFDAGFSGVASGNTGNGAYAMQNVTTGSGNTGLGNGAGALIDTGANNTCVGQSSGSVIVSGNQNVCIGRGANTTGDGAQNQIAVGYGAVAPFDNSARIGSTAITAVFFGNNTAILHADGSQLSGMSAVVPTVTTPTVIDGTQYLALTLGGVTYNVAIVTPGT